MTTLSVTFRVAAVSYHRGVDTRIEETARVCHTHATQIFCFFERALRCFDKGFILYSNEKNCLCLRDDSTSFILEGTHSEIIRDMISSN